MIYELKKYREAQKSGHLAKDSTRCDIFHNMIKFTAKSWFERIVKIDHHMQSDEQENSDNPF